MVATEADAAGAPQGTRLTYLDLISAPNAVLEEALVAGTMPDARRLAGWEFRGYNTLDLTPIVGIRKFVKGFAADAPPAAARDRLQGYNVMTVQGSLNRPWDAVRSGGKPKRHGFYDVYPADEDAVDNKYRNALLLNYHCPRNPVYDPSRFLRDYLVQVDPGNPDLLLGKAYVALGRRRIFMSYFVLERLRRPEG